MRYLALATDYDETIAFDGRVDEPTVEALRRVKAAGLRLVLVTGRELTDLFNTFEYPDLFERIVAENGAVIYDPATQSVESISSAPPPVFVETLERQLVPLSVGHTIVATVEPVPTAGPCSDPRLGSRVARDFQQGLGDGIAIGCDKGHRSGACAGRPSGAARPNRRRRRC